MSQSTLTHEHDNETKIRDRAVGFIVPANGGYISLELGLNSSVVGLLMIHAPVLDSLDDDDEEATAGVALLPAEALLLADRLTRAAHLVLEAGEDAANAERSARDHAENQS